jgi:hypothetical protein
VDEAEPGATGYHVTAAEDPRETLVRLAVDRRWPLLELRRQSESLDDIFERLTGESA